MSDLEKRVEKLEEIAEELVRLMAQVVERLVEVPRRDVGTWVRELRGKAR